MISHSHVQNTAGPENYQKIKKSTHRNAAYHSNVFTVFSGTFYIHQHEDKIPLFFYCY